MKNINHVSLNGRLTRDIEIRYTSGGMAIGNFAIAVNDSTKTNGSWQEVTYFFDCTLFGKSAENLKQYLVKGTKVSIDGKLKQDRWEKDGQKFSKIGIVINDIELIGGKSNDSSAPKKDPVPESVQHLADAVGGEVQQEEFPEDIPF